MLVLPLLAGSLADRWSKRRILMATQGGMGLCGLVVGLLVVTGVIQLWMVFALALLLGITAAFDGPARQSFVSEMVPGPDLTSAVSLNASSFNSGRLSFYDGVPTQIFYLYTNVRVKHPYTANLFINWSLSEDGQRAIASTGRSPVLQIDSPLAINKLLPNGVTVASEEATNDMVNNQQSYLSAYNSLWPV